MDKQDTTKPGDAQDTPLPGELRAAPFIRASDDDSDPVGTIGGDWGFWDEIWTHWHGGYTDEAAARVALAAYADTL